MKEEEKIFKKDGIIYDLDDVVLTDIEKDKIKKELKPKCFNKPDIISVKGHFDFESQEEDMANYFLYNLQKVDKSNPDVYKITFNCDEIIKFYNMPKGSDTYESIKEAFKSIRDKSIWWIESKDENGNIIKEKQKTLYFWYDVVCEIRREMIENAIDKEAKKKELKNKRISSKIEIKIDPKNFEIIEYATKNYFGNLNIQYIHDLENKYSKRIYQMLYTYYKHREIGYKKENKPVPQYIQYSVYKKDLRSRLKLENKYKEDRDFNKYVIKKVVEEINNKKNDLTIMAVPKKDKVVFLIENKDCTFISMKESEEHYKKMLSLINEAMNKEQKQIIGKEYYDI